MSRVSVVIPAYNAASFIRECIESVLTQTLPAYEVIVVDDGSRDETASIVAGFGSRVQCLKQENQGVSSARNHGARVANGEWLAFLDADDAWRPEKLEAQIRAAATEENQFLHCGSERIDDEGRSLGQQLDGLSGEVAAGMLLFRGNHANGSTTLVSRELFLAVGGYDPALSTSADWDMCFRLGMRSRLSFVAKPLAFYRQHGANMHANPALMRKDMLRAFGKAFSNSAPDIVALRRPAYAALHLMLAGSFAAYGDRANAMRHGLLAMTWQPGSLLPLLKGSWRRARRIGGGGL